MDGSRERIGVVGLGYVGLPLALAFTRAGYEVIGVDIDETRVETLRAGESSITDVDDNAVATALAEGFRPTTNYAELSDAEGVSICVPTPLRKTATPEMSYVADAVERLAEVVPQNCTVVLESTVYPGATTEVVVPAFEEEGYLIGEDLFLAFSPERIDPGNEEYEPHEIPKVLGGVTDACGDRAEALYDPVFDELVRVTSATEAELVKLLENTFRAVNIGLINEIAQIAHKLDVDIWSVVDAAATKPFGFMPFYPGPGLGGHCIPVDPTFLSWKANQHGIETRFIDLADRINREMPRHVVRRITDFLNDNRLALPDANVLVVGVAYKPGVTDTRESPAYDVIEELSDRNASISYHDPYVPVFGVGEETYESCKLTPELLASHDCTVIITNHSEVDYDMVVENAPLVFDTRNATKGQKSTNVRRL